MLVCIIKRAAAADTFTDDWYKNLGSKPTNHRNSAASCTCRVSHVYRLSKSVTAAGAKIVSLAAGAEHSLAVSASGQVFSWGCGSNGRLGHAQSRNRLWFWNRDEATPRLVQSFTEKAVSVSCGHMHSGRAWLCCIY